MTGTGQGGPGSPRRGRGSDSSAVRPGLARRSSATTARQHGQEAVDVVGASCPRCRDSRTLPLVSAPMAASTWLGCRVERRARRAAARRRSPRGPAPCVSDSPSTYRHENVSTCGSRSSGSPTTSTPGTRATTSRAQPVDERPQARVLGRRLRLRGLQPDGRGDGQGQGSRRAPRLLAGQRRATSGCPCARPAPTTPGGPAPPPGVRRSAATSRPAPARGPARPWRRPAAGTPRPRAGLGHRATGWSVPTSPLALCRQASADARGAATAARRPPASTRPRRRPPTSTACRRAAGVQDRGVLHRAVHHHAPGAAARAQHAQHAERRGQRRPRPRTTPRPARAPTTSADGLRGAVQQQPCAAAGGVAPLRVGAALVERRQQRRAGGRVQRRPRRRVASEGRRSRSRRGSLSRPPRVRRRASAGGLAGAGIRSRRWGGASPDGPAGHVGRVRRHRRGPVVPRGRPVREPHPRARRRRARRMPRTAARPVAAAVRCWLPAATPASLYENSLQPRLPRAGDRPGATHLRPLAGLRGRGDRGRRLRLRADLLRGGALPEARRGAAAAGPLQPAGRGALHRRPLRDHRRALLLHGAERELRQQADEGPGGHDRRRGLPVELAVQLRPGGAAGHRRARRARRARAADRPHHPLRRDLPRRHPLLLGAGSSSSSAT